MEIVYDFPPSKNNYSKDYGVGYTFKPQYRTKNIHAQNALIRPLFEKMRNTLRSILLYPELHPSDATVHYHGRVSIKDMRGWKKSLRILEQYGSFHLFVPTSMEVYMQYSLKDYNTTMDIYSREQSEGAECKSS